MNEKELIKKLNLPPDGRAVPGAVYGLWDTTGNAWLGRADGPIKYKDRRIAHMAADIMTERCGYRIEAKRLPGDPFKYKDEITPIRTAEEAIQRIEDKA